MPTPPLASVAKTDSEADLTALKDAANQNFINDAIVAIAQANANGQFEVFMTTHEYCDVRYLAKYFQNLGYSINFPEYPWTHGGQPAELFGQAYIDYWEFQLTYMVRDMKNPIRIGFGWIIPTA
jgi:hypothetical protein